MGMIRVYELAKVLDMSSKELLDRLNKAGLKLKSHSSNVDEARARSVLTAEPPKKKVRAKPKPMESGPPAKVAPAKPMAKPHPKAGKAEGPMAAAHRISVARPAGPKLAEPKPKPGPQPIAEGTPATKSSPVRPAARQKPQVVPSPKSTGATVALEQPSPAPPKMSVQPPAALRGLTAVSA